VVPRPAPTVLFINNLIPHRSLDNVSDGVRWSLDLRWQDAALPNAFHGLKPSLVLSKHGDARYRPDWAAWAGDSRQGKEVRCQRLHAHIAPSDDAAARRRPLTRPQLATALADPRVAAEIAKALALDAPTATGMIVTPVASADSAPLRDGDAEGEGGGGGSASEAGSVAASGVGGGSGPVAATAPGFDTVIAGPWMARWAIVHHNRHVNRYLADAAAGTTSWHSAASF